MMEDGNKSGPEDLDVDVASRGTSVVGAPPLTRRNLPMMLLLVRERVISRFRPLLHANGLTEQQWRILRVVHDAHALEQRQIAQACGMSAPSLAGVLSRMEALGLVKRARPAHDQRRVRVVLTAGSRDLVAVLAPQIEGVYRQLEADLGAAVIGDLIQSLDSILATLDGLRDGDASMAAESNDD